ncbi:flagellar protein [Pseudoalteromonas porphyrae]|uniref:Flagellar protein n=2 Tax=Pseudoalteromonas TaxID=53246 RepID=A0A0N1ELY7_9GAMM|nr:MULTISPECIES: flagellar biosynthetic protein FliO [Pseudoalteromonas]KPH63930.1 flagellar protein [Pseudoalteromonas porphyrae]KPH96319.1 flagellar protein [Pseudoalteromonas porphyrae]NNG42244.1 flagellar biosynthetic protein FliO [Pseudoalteromonas sp. NEC-BIFX-2020_002]
MSSWLLLSTASSSVIPKAAASGDLISMVMSLVMVLVLIVILAFLVKKLNPNIANSDEFKIVRSLPLSTRERLMVVEIDNCQHLLGVTPHSINYLHKLETPLTEKELPALVQRFSKLLNPQSNQNKKNL